MEGSTTSSKLEFELPGFRFHPNEEELLNFYLRSIVHGKKIRGDIIGFLNIYNHDPRELPGLAKIGEREWYFFVCRDRKHGSGGRPSRTTKTGFWKATGSDKKIMSASDPKKMLLGHRKTLVFYEGRAPRGAKTDWVMNEYRLPDHECSGPNSKDIVLCKIYKKATPLKVLEQRAALMEEEEDDDDDEEEEEDRIDKIQDPTSSNLDQTAQSRCSIVLGRDNLTQLEVPKFNMDWKQDYIWMLENLSPFLPISSFAI